MVMSAEEGDDGYTKDGSVDLKGNPVLRSQRGGWTACSFVVVYEVFERMAYYGISSNLILYLTKKLHQGTVTASNSVTNWVGTIWITPILGAYIADAYLGRYYTFLIASVIYLSGMFVLTLAVSIPGLKPPTCTQPDIGSCEKASTLQLGVFYGALYTLAVGTGGTKSNISTIGADQFDENNPKEKAYKLTFFNWWMFSVFFGTLFANTVLVYIQDNVGWTVGYAIPTVGLAISISIFLAGTRFYRHRVPTGSPFTKMAKVIMAAIRKWRVVVPSDPKELYELQNEDYSNGNPKIDCTNSLRFLNKAAVKTSSRNDDPWMLCSVSQVEETKQMLRMIPILVCSVIPCVMVAQSHTLFIKQGTTLNRSIGKTFKIPPASLTSFDTISMLISLVLYDKIFVPFMRQKTKNPRGITNLQRFGIGLFIYIILMIVASAIENKRLHLARHHEHVPLSIFVLLPQFVLLGIGDVFFEVAKIEFFYDQAPEGMKSLGSSFSMTAYGIGNFVSSFLLSTVSKVTRRKRHHGWILNNLNDSHLDYYYAFLGILGFLNLLIFVFVAKSYVYKVEIGYSSDVAGEMKGLKKGRRT